jgi:hypothetical protein
VSFIVAGTVAVGIQVPRGQVTVAHLHARDVFGYGLHGGVDSESLSIVCHAVSAAPVKLLSMDPVRLDELALQSPRLGRAVRGLAALRKEWQITVAEFCQLNPVRGHC